MDRKSSIAIRLKTLICPLIQGKLNEIKNKAQKALVTDKSYFFNKLTFDECFRKTRTKFYFGTFDLELYLVY